MAWGYHSVRLRGGNYPLPDFPTGCRVWHHAALPTTNQPSLAGLSAGLWPDLGGGPVVVNGSLCPFIVCPMFSDVRGDDTCGAGKGDVVEFPGMSGSWWRVLSVIDRNKALPNEYRVAMVTRIGPYTYPQR